MGNDPINSWDPFGEECAIAGETTTCKTDDYDVTFPTQEGFKDTDSSASDYHQYTTEGQSHLGASETREWVKNNPTPGSPDPATPEGTRNDATPVIGGLPGNISPVASITTTNQVSGNEVVVNVTLPGHPLGNGIVVRDTVANANGTSTIRNFGEGNGRLQAPGSIVAPAINGVWKGQTPFDHKGKILNNPNFCRAC